MDLPRDLLEALHNAITAFKQHDLEPPTAMIVGEDIQRRLFYAGFRPSKGTWGTIMGIEIRGVSDYIAGMLEGSPFSSALILLPEHLRMPTFKQQILGEFVEQPENDNES